MKLYLIRGGTEKELNNREYQIGVGVSLGNKWFTTENTIGLVEWSLQNTKDLVIVYVADLIHSINLGVRKGISKQKAGKMADEMGTEFLENLKLELQKKLPVEQFEKVKFVKWKELLNSDYLNLLDKTYSFYNSNLDFKNEIHAIVKEFTGREIRKFSEEQVNDLGKYIVEELPEILNRVNLGKYKCDAHVYPFDGSLTRFVEDIQDGKIFSEIKEAILITKPKVFLEVR